MKCIAETIVHKMIESKNMESSLDKLVLLVLDGISSYSERIDDLIYYTFEDDSLLGIKETTGEVRYRPWSIPHNSMIEVSDFLLDEPLEYSDELDEEFCTIDIDIEDSLRLSAVESYLNDNLGYSSLTFLKEKGYTNGAVLYHAILNQALSDNLDVNLIYNDDIILHYLYNKLSPASFSLLDTKYELCDQLFDLFLNEQIIILLKKHIDEKKLNLIEE